MELTDDIKPIYLGYEEGTRTYYFYFIKEGVPRFLVYVTYFYWGKGPQTALSLITVPAEIEEELEQFLSGNLHYEFIKVRKNSKQSSIKKLYRLPQQVGGRPATVVDGDGGHPVKPGTVKQGNTLDERRTNESNIPIVKRKKRTKPCPVMAIIEPPKVVRKRRTKAEMQELKKLPVKQAMDVSTTNPVVVSSEVINVTKKRKSSNRKISKY